ncbi:MAG: OsmC family peroxiredoxin [Alphaproteobacteria bacterium]|nr:MAG: OsmC family peroxiredoxin [Alphaproteobacteria bacterium]
MAIRPKTVVTGRLAADCPSHARADVRVRDTGMVIDEPVERGGTNAGPSPTETAVAALIGCTNVIGHKCADKLGIDIGHLHVDAEFDLDRRGVLLQEEIEVPFRAVRLRVTADGPASAEDLARVAAETEKFCAVSKLFKNAGCDVQVSWQKA